MVEVAILGLLLWDPHHHLPMVELVILGLLLWDPHHHLLVVIGHHHHHLQVEVVEVVDLGPLGPGHHGHLLKLQEHLLGNLPGNLQESLLSLEKPKKNVATVHWNSSVVFLHALQFRNKCS